MSEYCKYNNYPDLVLIQQLSPTIQGSEPEHEAGLEQTLFDRLMKMVSLPGWRRK